MDSVLAVMEEFEVYIVCLILKTLMLSENRITKISKSQKGFDLTILSFAIFSINFIFRSL